MVQENEITDAIAGKVLDDTIPKIELIKEELQYKEKCARTHVREHIKEQHEDVSKYLESKQKTKRRQINLTFFYCSIICTTLYSSLLIFIIESSSL